MSYTVAFDNTYPPGNTASSLISQTFRDKTTMIGERLVDLFGMPNYTDDPLKPQYVRVGYAGSGTGGFVKFTDDGGTYRWFSGIGSGAGNKNFVIFDVVNSISRLVIDKTTGAATFANDLTVSGNIGTPGNLTVNGIAKLGVTGTNTGGQLQYVTDDGVNRWATGILHSPSETRFVIYDNARGVITFQIDPSNASIITAGNVRVQGSNGFALGSWGGVQRIQYGSDAVNSFTFLTSADTHADVYGLTFYGALTGNVTGNVTGNAATATKLAATKNINGVAFDGSADITVAAAAGTLTGATLAANVVSSSLTSVGTIATGVWQGTAIADTYLAGISGSKVSGAVATATNATQLGGVAAASYALLSGAAFTGNISVPHANSMSAGSFFVI